MHSKSPLQLDLNNLFQPSVADAPKDIQEFDSLFQETHRAINAMRVTGHLTFSNLPQDTILLEQVSELAKNYEWAQNVLVFGIGGSALGTMSFYHAIGGPFANTIGVNEGKKRLFVVDYIEPWTLHEILNHVKKDQNLFIIISKSGNTAETLAQYLFLKNFFPHLKKEQLVIITDPQSGFLRKLVEEENLTSLSVPTGVGGRFSIFSAVGLFPLAVAGIDIEQALLGAAHTEEKCRQSILAQNPAGLLATTLNFWIEQRKMSQVVMMPYSDRLRFFTDWFAQLWAESLGKRYNTKGEEVFTGTTPIKSLGVADQHSQLQLYLEGPRDKVLLFIDVADRLFESPLGEFKSFSDERIAFLENRSVKDLLNFEKIASEECLRENGRPNGTVLLPELNEYQLGQIYQLFMNIIPYMGIFSDINAFDQPAVERIKQFTFGLLGRKGYEEFAQTIAKNKKRSDLIF